MKIFLTLLKWDFLLLLKYRILAVALLIAALYLSIFLAFPIEETGFEQEIAVALIFSDPAVMGFMFIGAIVLFEKDARTLQGLVVTPIKPWQYLWSKTISLTLLALPIGMVIAMVAHGLAFNYVALLLGLISASLMFTFAGFIGVARVQTLNQYLILIPLFLLPLCLPLFELMGFVEGQWIYLIPSKACFVLLEGAFQPLKGWEWVYSLGYSMLWVWIFYFFAERAFTRHIIPAS